MFLSLSRVGLDSLKLGLLVLELAFAVLNSKSLFVTKFCALCLPSTKDLDHVALLKRTVLSNLHTLQIYTHFVGKQRIEERIVLINVKNVCK